MATLSKSICYLHSQPSLTLKATPISSSYYSNTHLSLPISNSPLSPLSIGNKNVLLPILKTSESSYDYLSVTCPCIAYSNTLLFSAYNVQVVVDENESEESLVRRFRREVLRAGILQEAKRRRYFETTQELKKRKIRESAKRNRKRRPRLRTSPSDKQEMQKKIEVEEDDNWEVPDIELPYCQHI